MDQIKIVSDELDVLEKLKLSIKKNIPIKKALDGGNNCCSVRLGHIYRMKFYKADISELLINLLRELKNLEEIIFEECKIDHIDSSLTQLRSLSIIQCNISSIPDWILKIAGLSELIFTNNRIKSIPNSIITLKLLEHLDLSYNLIKEIPDCLISLQNLKILNLSKNNLEKWPEILKELLHLRELDLHSNQIAMISEVQYFKRVRSINLRNNRITDVPDCFSQDFQLEIFMIGINNINNVPRSLFLLENLKVLDLSANHLERLPDTSPLFSNLTQLDLSANNLKMIPNWISTLSKLTMLNFANNQIATFNQELFQLPSLKELSMGGNKFDGNDIEEFPSTLIFIEMTNLSLSSFPKMIQQMSEIETIVLSFNQIGIIPSWIESLKKLKTLYIQSNNVHSLPTGLWMIKSLQYLDVSDNPINTLYGIPREWIIKILQQIWKSNTHFPPSIAGLIKRIGQAINRYQFEVFHDEFDEEKNTRSRQVSLSKIDTLTQNALTELMNSYKDSVDVLVNLYISDSDHLPLTLYERIIYEIDLERFSQLVVQVGKDDKIVFDIQSHKSN